MRSRQREVIFSRIRKASSFEKSRQGGGLVVSDGLWWEVETVTA